MQKSLDKRDNRVQENDQPEIFALAAYRRPGSQDIPHMIVTLGAGHIDPRITEIEAEVARNGRLSDREDLRLSLQRAKFAFLDAVNQLQAYDTANAVGMVEAAVHVSLSGVATAASPVLPTGGMLPGHAPAARRSFPARALAFGAQRIGLLVGPY